jgi:hypothetical protein
MSQETSAPANVDVRALSEEEIDAVSGGEKNAFWRAVEIGALTAIANEVVARDQVFLNSK